MGHHRDSKLVLANLHFVSRLLLLLLFFFQTAYGILFDSFANEYFCYNKKYLELQNVKF